MDPKCYRWKIHFEFKLRNGNSRRNFASASTCGRVCSALGVEIVTRASRVCQKSTRVSRVWRVCKKMYSQEFDKFGKFGEFGQFGQCRLGRLKHRNFVFLCIKWHSLSCTLVCTLASTFAKLTFVASPFGLWIAKLANVASTFVGWLAKLANVECELPLLILMKIFNFSMLYG
jgi:hypothetical protein